jgi:hypothetical protein
MPTYSTPTPIDVAINLQVGRLEIVASDREDTVVTVSPSNGSKAIDRRGVDNTTIDFDGQRLTVVGPKPRLSWIGPGPADSIEITVELPTGSRLTAEVVAGSVRTSGRLGGTRIKASTGSVDVEASGDLWLRAAHGNATVGTADGGIDVVSSYGNVKVEKVTGDALLKSSHGSVVVGESGGTVETKLSYGDIDIAKALGSVAAKTAYGSIHLGEVSNGSIEADSGYGEVTIGVRSGIPAWLDLSSKNGNVRNRLESDAAPDAGEQTVAVRARTQWGDITVQRAG